ncbi:MAG TPA: AAA family ATPase [Solirubrobacteraceae bacterium]|nr:AAA family ATPase [Solirubrobacteraceae bacterium]
MARVLVTGMSGTGKSTALGELAQLGFRTVDTDEGGWSSWSESDGGYVWNEERISELLAAETDAGLYVSGTVSNQGRFYPRFDAIVLLSAPPDVLLSRLARRTNNSYGKSREERELILRQVAEVEPRLRRACTHEIDATQPIDDVVAALIEIATAGGT